MVRLVGSVTVRYDAADITCCRDDGEMEDDLEEDGDGRRRVCAMPIRPLPCMEGIQAQLGPARDAPQHATGS